MSKKMKRPSKTNKPKPVIKPVKAWAVLNAKNQIEAGTTSEDKGYVSDVSYADEKVIRVEIRAI